MDEGHENGVRLVMRSIKEEWWQRKTRQHQTREGHINIWVYFVWGFTFSYCRHPYVLCLFCLLKLSISCWFSASFRKPSSVVHYNYKYSYKMHPVASSSPWSHKTGFSGWFLWFLMLVQALSSWWALGLHLQWAQAVAPCSVVLAVGVLWIWSGAGDVLFNRADSEIQFKIHQNPLHNWGTAVWKKLL